MLRRSLTQVEARPEGPARPFKAIIIDLTGRETVAWDPDAATLAGLASSLLEQGAWLVLITDVDYDVADREFCGYIPELLRTRLLIAAGPGGPKVYGFSPHGSAELRYSQEDGDRVPDERGSANTGDALRWIMYELQVTHDIAAADTLMVVVDRAENAAADAESAVPGSLLSQRDQTLVYEMVNGERLLSVLLDQVNLGYLAAHPAPRSIPAHDFGQLYGWLATDVGAPSSETTWRLPASGYVAGLEGSIESRMALGNGFVGVRSALLTPTRGSHPAHFVAGFFGALLVPSGVTDSEPPTSVPALVPLPDAYRLDIQIDGTSVDLTNGTILELHRWLDLPSGLFVTQWYHALPGGQSLRVRLCRGVSLQHRHLAWQSVEISPGREARLVVRVPEDGPGDGLVTEQSSEGLVVWRTPDSLHRVARARQSTLHVHGENATNGGPRLSSRSWSWSAAAGQPATFTEFVSYSRQQSHQETGETMGIRASALLRGTCGAGAQEVVAGHLRKWAERWAASDVQIQGDDQIQSALRFALHHLNSAANPEDDRVSIGARGLTGEAYLGHVFWDTDIFMLPFYTLTWPEAARSLLRYRYLTLPAARAKAQSMGLRGALYAWESADTGDEATPPTATFPDGHREPVVNGTQEQHISADVAYAVWQYWMATGDIAFLLEGGAEIILETARFWASRAVAETDSRYHIRHVIGPDEYHYDIDDNAFTNEMARWNIERGLEVAALLQRQWRKIWVALSQRIDLQASELKYWRKVAGGLAVRPSPVNGLIEQFSGFFALDPVDLGQLPRSGMPVDMVLGPERTRHSQVIKQADVVQLLALLGDQYTSRERKANFSFYEPICAHGSSLSPSVHALVAARLGEVDLAMRYLRQTAMIDLDDAVPAAALGVHMGALGGLWQAVVFGFVGLSIGKKGFLCMNPHLPGSWTSISLPVRWQGRLIRLSLGSSFATLTLEEGNPITMYVGELGVRLRPHQTLNCLWDEHQKRWKEARREPAL